MRDFLAGFKMLWNAFTFKLGRFMLLQASIMGLFGVAVTADDHRRGIPGWHVDQVAYPQVVSSEATVRRPLWVAPFNCELGEVALINSTAVTGANTNTVHFNLIDGGAEGAGTTELATRDLVSGTDLDVGKTLLYDNIQGASATLFMTQGDILELESEEVGTGLGSDINELLILVVYRAANLGS